jgi:type I restriction enzyme S subunit
LERIQKELKAKQGNKYKEPKPLNTSDLPDLPEGWIWTTMDNISVKITDGEHIRPKMVKKGVPFLSAKNVQDNGIIFDGKLYVSQDDAARFRQRCNPERNDILIVSRGATVSRTCVINVDKEFCLLGSVILIKPSRFLRGKFIAYMLKSSTIQKAMIELSGSTAQQAIYIRDIRNLLTCLCTLLKYTLHIVV